VLPYRDKSKVKWVHKKFSCESENPSQVMKIRRLDWYGFKTHADLNFHDDEELQCQVSVPEIEMIIKTKQMICL